MVAVVVVEHMPPSKHWQTIAIGRGGEAAAFARVIEQDFLAAEGRSAIVGPSDRNAAAGEGLARRFRFLGVGLVEPADVKPALGADDERLEALALDQRLRLGEALAAVSRPCDEDRALEALFRPRGEACDQGPVRQRYELWPRFPIVVERRAFDRGDHKGRREALAGIARDGAVDLSGDRVSEPQTPILAEKGRRGAGAFWRRVRAFWRGSVAHVGARRSSFSRALLCDGASRKKTCQQGDGRAFHDDVLGRSMEGERLTGEESSAGRRRRVHRRHDSARQRGMSGRRA